MANYLKFMASPNDPTRQALQALRRPGSVLFSVESQAIGGELVSRDFATQFLQPTVAMLPGRETAKNLAASLR